MDEKLAQKAMEIIVQAGSARTYSMGAIDAMAEFDFEKAKDQLAKADEELLIAHRVHTEVLQNSMSEETDYSVLFAHAQDTMMNTMSEIEVAKKYLGIFIALDKRLGSLENKGVK